MSMATGVRALNAVEFLRICGRLKVRTDEQLTVP